MPDEFQAFHPAEERIHELGITRPQDIDVDAIAYDAGVLVRYESLNGCQATLAGFRDKGIATIHRQSIRVRQRFSIGHELGHWCHHRGRSFRCRVDDQSENLAAPDKIMEQEADSYAAHLLLPGQLFRPILNAAATPSFTKLVEIATEFEASILATALRVVGVNAAPAILVCHRGTDLRWFQFASDVPRRWYLKRKLDADTFAYDAMINGRTQVGFRKSSADSWFTNGDADKFEVQEHSLVRGAEVLTLLLLEQPMLCVGFDADAFPKKYNEFGAYIPKAGLKR